MKYTEQSAWFKGQRRADPFNFVPASTSRPPRPRCGSLDKAFANFFRRVKGESRAAGLSAVQGGETASIASSTLATVTSIRLTGNRLRVQHVGTIRVKLHRPVEGVIKTWPGARAKTDKWFVVASCDLGDLCVKPSALPPVGIDVGLESFLTTSEGNWASPARATSRPLCRSCASPAAPSPARRSVASTAARPSAAFQKVHARVENARREHHHAVACRLVLAFGLIAVEALHIKGMLAGNPGHPARSVTPAGPAS